MFKKSSQILRSNEKNLLIDDDQEDEDILQDALMEIGTNIDFSWYNEALDTF